MAFIPKEGTSALLVQVQGQRCIILKPSLNKLWISTSHSSSCANLSCLTILKSKLVLQHPCALQKQSLSQTTIGCCAEKCGHFFKVASLLFSSLFFSFRMKYQKIMIKLLIQRQKINILQQVCYPYMFIPAQAICHLVVKSSEELQSN